MLADAKPFGLTPDPRYLFASQSHVRTLETLQAAIARRDCFAVVTGEVGTGKTTLCRALADHSNRNVLPALVLHPPSSEEELLTETLASLGIISREERRRTPPPTRQALLNALQDFLQSLLELGAIAVLVIDEAQNMPAAVLEQVRVMANLTASKENLLQVVLVGQSTLPEVLRAPELKHLDQRLSLRCELNPLTEDETSAYVLHRLGIADPDRSVTFSPDALRLVHEYSNGIPRLVNLICHRALIAAQRTRSSIVDDTMVSTALEGLELKSAEPVKKSWFGRFRRA